MPSGQLEARWYQKLGKRIAASRVGSWVFSRVLHRIDKVLLKLSGGRVSVPQTLAGLPVIRLTAEGAKSGKERTVPVLGFRDGEDWIIVASNWGGESHPAWYHNLQANPEVEVTYGDQTAEYVAHEVTGEERDSYWELASNRYAGFEAYRRRSGDREIPIMVLSPNDE